MDCTKGKQYAAKLDNDAKRQPTKPLEIVHSGDIGPIKNIFIVKARYLENLWVYMTKSNGKWFERFEEL